MTLKMAVPNKGRLNERAVELLLRSGLDLGEGWGRRLYVNVRNQDIEVIFVRAQDIPEFVASGAIDIGITGEDQIAEAGEDLEKLLDLDFGHCRLSVAVPEASGIKNIDDIKDGCRVATSFPSLAKKFFASKKKKVDIINVSGAAEIMPYLGVSDIIVDLVSSGSTLKTNRLVTICDIMESQAVIVGNKKAVKSKKDAVNGIVNSVRSVIVAESKKYLMADVPKDKLDEVQRMFPGMAGPTVMNIAGRDDMVAMHVVVDKKDVYDSVNALKKMGAHGILTLPIERLVP
ncbi:MAG: ATP phosphoribosyltransferase [Methanomassiliicoccaceae archaeon]|jgi:ATP phosphoribosyltransferase|nr:ATP phosphoribosyltransferase [Methanomassiliicoccaceae archaeon]